MEAMLEGPPPSATVVEKVWKEPEPEAGSVETTAGGPEAGTVQVPVVVQALDWLAMSWAKPKVFLTPLNPKAKLSGKLTARVLPLVENALPAGVMGPWKVVPASFIKYKKLLARL